MIPNDLINLIETLKEEKFDWYIGISRAGISVMYFFSLKTDQKLLDIFCNKDKSWGYTTGKKILIMDDTIETGKTMMAVKKELERWNPSVIKILVLSSMKDASIKPDFCLEYREKEIVYNGSFNPCFCDIFRVGLCPINKEEIKWLQPTHLI